MEYDMDMLAKLSEEQKIAFMKALVRLAKADGVLDEDEKKFLLELAQIYGIGKERQEEIISVKNDEEIIEVAKTIKDRRAALELVKEMCILAHADDELSEDETLLIGKIGQAMGVELEKISQISQWVIDKMILQAEKKIIFEEV